MSNNAVELELSQCLQDIEIVQKELDDNLTLLAQNVDQGFGQLRAINKQCREFAKELTKSGHEIAGMSVQLASAAVTGVAQAWSAAKAAQAHNEALDKLIKQKRKIAREKMVSVFITRRKASANYERLEKLFSKEITQEYSEQDLLDNLQAARAIANEINRIDDFYKLAAYNLNMIDYLLHEYRAWMDNEQTSGQKRPIMLYVNNEIKDFLFDQEEDNTLGLNFNSVISRDGREGKVTGAELLFLTDSSITACGILDNAFATDGEVAKLDVKPAGIAAELIENNDAYELYKESQASYEYGWYKYAIGGVIAIGLSLWFTYACWGWMSDWWAFFRWVAMIIVVGIEAIIVGILCNSLYESAKENRQKTYEDGFQTQLNKAGYVEIYQPDLEKKDVVVEGVKGLFNGLFN